MFKGLDEVSPAGGENVEVKDQNQAHQSEAFLLKRHKKFPRSEPCRQAKGWKTAETKCDRGKQVKLMGW